MKMDRHIRDGWFNSQAHVDYIYAHNSQPTTKFILVNPLSPSDVYTIDTEVGIWPSFDYDITITKIVASLNVSTHEVAGDLMYADDFITLDNPIVIQVCDTTLGVLNTGTISVAVPAGKCLYYSFDSEPNTAITQMPMRIDFEYG